MNVRYTRLHTPASWHLRQAAYTLLTGGLWGVVWWWSYRMRRRPMTETYDAPAVR
jgi:hypothetical protein